MKLSKEMTQAIKDEEYFREYIRTAIAKALMEEWLKMMEDKFNGTSEEPPVGFIDNTTRRL